MKKFLLIGTCLIALSACQAHNPQTQGALIGGLTGGLLGNTIGKGSGRTAAILGGAVLGTIVGSELAGGTHGHAQPQHRTVVTVGQCNHIANDGARSSCERGVAERDRAAQRQAEQRAYQCGRYGRCN
jgi:predicted lipid-binding transport protein (Tim44 family)